MTTSASPPRSRRKHVKTLPFEARAEMQSLARTRNYTGPALARMFGCNRKRATQVLAEVGIFLPRYPAPSVTEADELRVRALAKTGLSPRLIADQLKESGERPLCESTVRNILREAGAA